MISFMLKKALPFTLTLVVGAVLGSLFQTRRAQTWTWPANAQPALGSEGPFGGSKGRRECRMRRHNLVAESRPLTILFTPDAASYSDAGTKSVRVNVTFGADGKVQKVEHRQTLLPETARLEVESAARRIEFMPEIVNGIPVTVEKEVEIHLVAD